jgi:hypothetical protein
MTKYNIFDFYYDRETKTLWVYKKILVSELIYLKKKYEHVEVRGEETKGR